MYHRHQTMELICSSWPCCHYQCYLSSHTLLLNRKITLLLCFNSQNHLHLETDILKLEIVWFKKSKKNLVKSFSLWDQILRPEIEKGVSVSLSHVHLRRRPLSDTVGSCVRVEVFAHCWSSILYRQGRIRAKCSFTRWCSERVDSELIICYKAGGGWGDILPLPLPLALFSTFFPSLSFLLPWWQGCVTVMWKRSLLD